MAKALPQFSLSEHGLKPIGESLGKILDDTPYTIKGLFERLFCESKMQSRALATVWNQPIVIRGVDAPSLTKTFVPAGVPRRQRVVQLLQQRPEHLYLADDLANRMQSIYARLREWETKAAQQFRERSIEHRRDYLKSRPKKTRSNYTRKASTRPGTCSDDIVAEMKEALDVNEANFNEFSRLSIADVLNCELLEEYDNIIELAQETRSRAHALCADIRKREETGGIAIATVEISDPTATLLFDGLAGGRADDNNDTLGPFKRKIWAKILDRHERTVQDMSRHPSTRKGKIYFYRSQLPHDIDKRIENVKATGN